MFGVIALLGSIALLVGPHGAAAQAPTFFYRASGQANATFIEIQRPGYILDPVLQLNPLDTQVTVSSTGIRDSLASLLNPGPLGDFPSLIGLAVSGLPPIPYPGYPLTVRASHPVEPEAAVGLGDSPGGAGTATASLRAFTSAARAGENSADANGTAAFLSLAAGLVRVGGVEASTSAVDTGASVIVTATTRIAGVEIGGFIEIEALETTSVATIDGSRVLIETSSTVGAVRALGAELAIDEDGFRVVTILGLPAPPPAVLDGITKNLTSAMDALGIDVRLVDGGTVEGPADSLTLVRGGGAGLEITVPVTIPADVAIPSTPLPLGIPLGGGIPTNVTVALGRTSISAMAGSMSGFDADTGFGLPGGGTGSPTALGVPIAGYPPGAGSTISSGGVELAGRGDAAAPSTGAPLTTVSSSLSTPDLTAAFRWTLLTGAFVLVAGWPIARRRLAGVPGLGATAILESLLDPRRPR